MVHWSPGPERKAKQMRTKVHERILEKDGDVCHNGHSGYVAGHNFLNLSSCTHKNISLLYVS